MRKDASLRQGLAFRGLALILGVGLLAACGGSGGGGGGVASGAAPKTRFDMAHGCYVLRANEAYVARSGGGFAAVEDAPVALAASGVPLSRSTIFPARLPKAAV